MKNVKIMDIYLNCEVSRSKCPTVLKCILNIREVFPPINCPVPDQIAMFKFPKPAKKPTRDTKCSAPDMKGQKG